MDIKSVEAIYPLSPVQEAIIRLGNPESADHCGNVSCSFECRLDVALLNQAWEQLVRQHPILRTAFVWKLVEKPMQVVHRRLPALIEQHDLRALSKCQQKARLEELLRTERERGFVVSEAPLMRLALCHVAENAYQFLWTYHRLILDDLSVSLLLNQLVAFYEQLATGRVAGVNHSSYRRYISWLGEQNLAKAEEFWRSELRGFVPQLFPAGQISNHLNSRPRSYEAEQRSLSRDTTQALQAFALGRQMTFDVIVQAAWALLLSQYSHEHEVLFGITVAGRPETLEGAESILGPFMNTVPLKAKISSDTTALTWLRELKSQNSRLRQFGYVSSLQIKAWSDIPLDQPLFESCIILAENPSIECCLRTQDGRLIIGNIQVAGQVDFPIVVKAVDGHELTLRIAYDAMRFDYHTVVRMLGHLECLLEKIADCPEHPLSKLHLLTEPERLQILLVWNKTATDYPRDNCVHQLFESQVESTPEAVAIVFEGEQLTYYELNRRANQLAHYLRRLGVRPDLPVGICVERSVEMVIGLLGILKAGGAYVPINTDYPLERITFILNETQLSILLTLGRSVESLPAHSALFVCLDSDWGLIAEHSEHNPTSETLPESLAYVMYTSGSTGRPKGVSIIHRGVVRLVKETDYISFNRNEVFLQLAPLSFDASTFEIWGALLNHARLVIMPARTPSLKELGQDLKRYGVTTLWLTAGLFHLMADQRLEDLKSLRQILAGGDVLSVSHVNKVADRLPETRLVNGYGPTEGTTFTCCYTVSRVVDNSRSVPIGSPIANTHVYLLNEHMYLVPVRVNGEIYIGGDGLARGYLNKPELTAERFVPHPFSTESGGRLYRTGDCGLYLEDGSVEFWGRVDHQVKIRGFRVELEEIEIVFKQHPSVLEAVVVASEDKLGKRLIAYAVCDRQAAISSDALQKYLRGKLPEYMIPSSIVLLEAMPLTRSGKIDRKALPMPELSLSTSEEVSGVMRTPVEEILTAIWSQVLGIEHIGVHDNFFALGGDSIRTIQVASLAEQKGLNLPVDKIFECQTIRELAQEVTISESPSELVQVPAFSLISEADRLVLPPGIEDAYPLTMLQSGMVFHSELSPESALYHDILSFHLRAGFDVQAFEAAASHIMSRHAVLRTSFDLTTYSEPLQLVHQTVPVPLQVEDLRHMSSEQQDEEIASWIEAEKRRNFDWTIPPLLRFQIHRRADRAFQFTLSLHHAIIDGWSLAELLTQLFRHYYSALCGHLITSEAPLSTTFRDYVSLEQEDLKSNEAKRYWTEKLDRSQPTLLPRWPFHSQHSSLNQSSYVLAPISSQVNTGLKRLADAAVAPLKSVLLAAHLRVLSLVSGQDDVVTGLVSNGRPQNIDSDRVIGLYLNTLPFRFRLEGGTWIELVRKTFAAEIEANPFRRYPMAQIQKDMGGQPLFETAFTFTHFHALDSLEKLSELEVIESTEFTKANIPFAPFFRQVSNQIELRLDYTASEISREQVKTIAGYYAEALAAMASDPYAPYDKQCLLPDAERQILEEWNNTSTRFHAEQTIHQFFEKQVEQTPDAIAIIFEKDSFTFRKLNQRANQLARHLRSLGVGPEVIVGLCVEPSLELIVGLLGILKAGGAFVSLDPEYPLDRLAFMVEEAQVSVLVTNEALLDRLPSFWAQTISLDTDEELLDRQSPENLELGMTGDNAVYLVFTSGSAGKPKGVLTTHQALINDVAAMIALAELDATHRLLQFVSLSFDASIQQIFMTLCCGASLALCRKVAELPPGELLCKCQCCGVTTLYLPPSYWQMMVDELSSKEQQAPEWLRLVLVGGESPSVERLAIWARMSKSPSGFVNAYGPAEATVTTTFYKAQMDAEALDLLIRLPIGRPIANTQVYLLDKHMLLVPIGTIGELYIGGSGLARGYFRHPELTAERFMPNAFGGGLSDGPGKRLYRTGDLARYLPRGDLEFRCRADKQVKVRGFRIELEEIESALRRNSLVRDAVVMAREDKAGSKYLVAYYVTAGESGPDANQLRSFLRKYLPNYMLPSAYVKLKFLPVTANGKIDLRALPPPQEDGPTYIAPRNKVEQALADIWSQLLCISRVGVEDDFFDLGGHSLLATQLFSRVREIFQVDVPLKVLFEKSTIADLAKSIEGARAAEQSLRVPPIKPVPRDNPLPLSFAQQRLWFLDQLRPGNSFYNISTVLRFTGRLNFVALKECLSDIIRRHEILRTTFEMVNGQPVQIIAQRKPGALAIVDLRAAPTNMLKVGVLGLATEETQRPFDLEKGPLFRWKLLRLGEEDHIAIITMHHIISDGWSIGVLTNEIAALYESFSAGRPSPLPEPVIQYADFALWQRKWLQDEVLETQLSFWKNRLGGLPQIIALPIDHPRPAVQSFRGARQNLELSPTLSEQIKELSRREGGTLFMTLLASFSVLLHRYSGQTDVVIGTDIANRNRREMEPLLGFFVNQLVLRTDLSHHPTFVEVLETVREVALEAYANQDLPFEKLVEALQPARDLSRTPIFQVKFVLQNAPMGVLELPGLTLSVLETDNGISRYDLTLSMEEVEGRLIGLLEYSTDLFEDSTITRMIGHFKTLLDGIVDCPDKQISKLQLLSERERYQILVEWNATERAFEEGITIQELFDTHVSLTPDAICVVAEDDEWSYREMGRRANQLAHHLRAIGVGPEVRVGICLERSPEMIMVILSIIKAGGAYVPLDPNHPLDRLAFILDDAQITVIVTTQRLIERLPAHRGQIVIVDTDKEIIAKYSGDDPANLTRPGTLAYVIYTSGTTGSPKGVLIQHRSVINLANWQANTFNITRRSRIAQIFSYNFDGAVGETFMALLNGATLVILDSNNLGPTALLENINKHRLTVGVFVPSMLRQLDLDLLTNPELLSVVSVGEACPPDLAKKWSGKCKFMNAYGPTEYTVYSHLWVADGIADRSLVPIGLPVDNTKTYILDAHLNPVPIGVIGEIYISGAGIGRGYLNQAEATASTFLPNEFVMDSMPTGSELIIVESARREIADFQKKMTYTISSKQRVGDSFPTRLMADAILELVKHLDADLISKTRAFVEEYDNDEVSYDCFCRYLVEGSKDNYASCGINSEVLRLILPFKSFDGLRGIDFCFGGGEVMQVLRRERAIVKGFDFNPFFVQKAREKGLDAQMCKVDVAPDTFTRESGVAEKTQDFAISVLALDRVGAPRNLLENLFRSLKVGGRFAIQTLLPIAPIDDGKVNDPIIYTREENRITPGVSVEQDKSILIALLSELGAGDIHSCQLPYAIASRDGLQNYQIWSFFGAKRAGRGSATRQEYYYKIYKTGDLGRYLPDGNIEFIGRSDRQVKLRGFRIELGEVEIALRSHSAIREAVVQFREDAPGEKRLVAYIVQDVRSHLTSTELREFLEEKLPEYMIPAVFVVMESLPLTANGKIDYRMLPSPDKSRPKLSVDFAQPETDVERIIADIWQESLKLEKVGVNDNFFDLGGHSLLIIEVNTKLRERLKRELSITELFQHPTISSLAKYLNQKHSEQPTFQESRDRAQMEKKAIKRQRQQVRGRNK